MAREVDDIKFGLFYDVNQQKALLKYGIYNILGTRKDGYWVSGHINQLEE